MALLINGFITKRFTNENHFTSAMTYTQMCPSSWVKSRFPVGGDAYHTPLSNSRSSCYHTQIPISIENNVNFFITVVIHHWKTNSLFFSIITTIIYLRWSNHGFKGRQNFEGIPRITAIYCHKYQLYVPNGFNMGHKWFLNCMCLLTIKYLVMGSIWIY